MRRGRRRRRTRRRGRRIINISYKTDDNKCKNKKKSAEKGSRKESYS